MRLFHCSNEKHAKLTPQVGEGTQESKDWNKSRLDELWEGQYRSARQAAAELRSACDRPPNEKLDANLACT